MNKKQLVPGLLTAYIFLAPSLLAEQNEQNSIDQEGIQNISDSEASQTQPIVGAGRIATINPKTGELTTDSNVTFKALRSTQAQLPPVKYTTYSNGTVGAALQGRFRTNLMATIGCDGKIATEHSEKLDTELGDCEEK